MTKQGSDLPLSRLPRGPHGLSTEEVERDQRDRLLMATAHTVAERGFAATSVAHIIAAAGVSRASFYQLFDSKLDCFLAAIRMASDTVSSLMSRQLTQLDDEPSLTPFERLDRLLDAYLRTLASEPRLAKVFLVDVYAAGPLAIQQRCDALERFVDVVAATHHGEHGLLGTRPDQRAAAEVLVGAVSSMVTNAVGVGHVDQLPALRGPLMAVAAQMLGHTTSVTDSALERRR